MVVLNDRADGISLGQDEVLGNVNVIGVDGNHFLLWDIWWDSKVVA